MLAHFQTIYFWKHQVQNHHIRLFFIKDGDRFLAVLRQQGLIILGLQKLRNIGPDIYLIFYNQNNIFHCAGSSSPVKGGSTITGRQ